MRRPLLSSLVQLIGKGASGILVEGPAARIKRDAEEAASREASGTYRSPWATDVMVDQPAVTLALMKMK